MSDERECYCDSRQCDICTPDAPPRGDLFAAAQTLAADNARLCGIVIAADKLAETVDRVLRGAGYNDGLNAALEAYKVVRSGH